MICCRVGRLHKETEASRHQQPAGRDGADPPLWHRTPGLRAGTGRLGFQRERPKPAEVFCAPTKSPLGCADTRCNANIDATGCYMKLVV